MAETAEAAEEEEAIRVKPGASPGVALIVTHQYISLKKTAVIMMIIMIIMIIVIITMIIINL